jgi:hypothetical protein
MVMAVPDNDRFAEGAHYQAEAGGDPGVAFVARSLLVIAAGNDPGWPERSIMVDSVAKALRRAGRDGGCK